MERLCEKGSENGRWEYADDLLEVVLRIVATMVLKPPTPKSIASQTATQQWRVGQAESCSRRN